MGILKKIIQKLQVSKYIYILENLCRIKKTTICFHTVNEAIEYLHSKSDDKGHSCIIDHRSMSFDCDVEVIVPCYNSENYIKECIDSILEQKTNYSFFVTIINDGSTDGTRYLLKNYENFSNVRIIDQDNTGHSGARNKGIDQSHGKYLLFVDSDDILLPGAIEELMSMAHKFDADVVDSGHIRFADINKHSYYSMIMSCVYNIIQKPQSLPLNLISTKLTGFPWGKVWKSDLFNRIQFPIGYWFEDTIVWMILEPFCKHKVSTNKITIRYRMNPNSISHTSYTSNKSIDSLYVTLRLLKDRDILGIEFDQDQYDNLLHQMQHNYYRVSNLDFKTKMAVFVVQQDLISNQFKNWNTTNPKLKHIEDFLRTNDFDGFELWCKWH